MTHSSRRQFCGRTRREFLWQAGGGFTALPLISLLSQDGFLSGEARAAERCILLEGTNRDVAISRHISVFLCNTPGGQMIYVTRSTWLNGRSTLLASFRDLQSLVSKPRP